MNYGYSEIHIMDIYGFSFRLQYHKDNYEDLHNVLENNENKQW